MPRDIEQFLMPVDTNIKLSSVILSDENKAKINTFLNEVNHREELIKYGLTPMNRLLFYGASGTGKTFLTKALSNYMGYTLLYVDIAKALSDNSVAQNIADIFAAAKEKGNCIIFLDECDSITMSRYTSDYSDTAQVRRATNSLFQQLDQMDPRTIFIAATNLLFKIDPAFERRMNLKLEFRRPDLNIKDAVKKFTFPGFEIVDDVDETTEDIVGRRAEHYAKLSYFELQGLVERSMKKAVINQTMTIRMSEIYSDLAIAMGIKFKFGTHIEPPQAFQHSSESTN